VSDRGRSPSSNCYNAVGQQYRYAANGQDARGGNVNTGIHRIRSDSEQKPGFACGFWTSMGRGSQAGGPSRVVNATLYIDSDRDIRPEDIVTVSVHPGLQFKVESVRGSPSSPPGGMISSFQMCDVVSVANVALPVEEVE